MTEQAKTWVIPEKDRPPDDFWIAYRKFIIASKMSDNSDYYWTTLVKWADALAKRYPGNDIVADLIMDYIDGQSKRDVERTKKSEEERND